MAFGLLLFLGLSYGAPAPAAMFEVRDDLGRRVVLDRPPLRIISLAPSVTETLYALGLGPQVVGVTAACDYPPEAKDKPSVGTAMGPDLERILSLQPDLIVAAKGIYRPSLVEELERLRLPLYVTDPTTLEAIDEAVERLGRLTGRLQESRQLTARMRAEIETIRMRVSGLPPRRVLYILWHDPLITVGPGSFVHELIGKAGGENIYATGTIPYSRFSMEEVVAGDPEVIIFASEIGEGVIRSEKKIWERRWKMLTAVRTERIFTGNSDLLHRPGPRIVEGLESLARMIHPEAFRDEAYRADR